MPKAIDKPLSVAFLLGVLYGNKVTDASWHQHILSTGIVIVLLAIYRRLAAYLAT